MATVSVRGTGTAAAEPDEVTVGLGVETLRATAAEAFGEATRLAGVVALCEELGVPAAARTTSRVSLSEHGEHTDAGGQHRGYRASSRIAVRLGDAELASRLVSEAAGRLETRVDGPGLRVLGFRAEAASMPLEGGEHELVAEVDVTYQLEQG